LSIRLPRPLWIGVATRKIARAASAFQDMFQGQRVLKEPVAKFRIVQRTDGMLKLQAFSQAGELYPDGFLTLVRVGEVGTDDAVGGGE
jgi:hypothetical protein